ncbi:MAG: 6-bladed beta-propeller [Mangrovibacterium sp.]|jgi:hypothetical protein
MKKLIYLLAILFFIYSCGLQNQHNQLDTIKISLHETPQIDVESIIESIDLVPLETNEDCLISHVDKIKIYEDKVFVLDRGAGNIIVFSSITGKFISKVSKQGKGFGEYITIADFDINPKNGELYIIDGMTDKVLVFKDAEFIRDYKLKLGAKVASICFLNTGNIAFSTQIYTLSDEWRYHLLITDNNLNLIKKDIHYEKIASLVMAPISSFVCFENTISYLPVYRDTIYHISKDLIAPKYKLDFGKNWIDEEFLYSKNLNSMTFLQELEKSNSIYFLNTIESNSHIFIYFTFKNEKYAFLYDKETGKGAFLMKYMENGCGYNGLPIIPDGNLFVGIINPYEVRDINEKILQNHPVLRSVKFENNPILSFIKFKKVELL